MLWHYDLTCPGCGQKGYVEFTEEGSVMSIWELAYPFFLKAGGTINCGCGHEVTASGGANIPVLRVVTEQ